MAAWSSPSDSQPVFLHLAALLRWLQVLVTSSCMHFLSRIVFSLTFLLLVTSSCAPFSQLAHVHLHIKSQLRQDLPLETFPNPGVEWGECLPWSQQSLGTCPSPHLPYCVIIICLYVFTTHLNPQIFETEVVSQSKAHVRCSLNVC